MICWFKKIPSCNLTTMETFMEKLRAGKFRTTPDFSKEDLKNKTDQELCDAIMELDCSNHQLIFLPALNRCTILFCSNNQLTSLPTLEKCTQLDCSSNQLTSLPALESCTELFCYNNKLTFLPELERCTKLNCSDNKLTSLPTLKRCTILFCAGNPLTHVPVPEEWYNNQVEVLFEIYRNSNINPCDSDDGVHFFTTPESAFKHIKTEGHIKFIDPKRLATPIIESPDIRSDKWKLLAAQDPFNSHADLYYSDTLIYRDRNNSYKIIKGNLNRIHDIIRLYKLGYIGISKYGLAYGSNYNIKTVEKHRVRAFEAYLKHGLRAFEVYIKQSKI
jgi:Leucine-rich repeat (LRR) protein